MIVGTIIVREVRLSGARVANFNANNNSLRLLVPRRETLELMTSIRYEVHPQNPCKVYQNKKIYPKNDTID